MAHFCANGMIQIKDMFQIVATWLQFSTEGNMFCIHDLHRLTVLLWYKNCQLLNSLSSDNALGQIFFLVPWVISIIGGVGNECYSLRNVPFFHVNNFSKKCQIISITVIDH